jgi:hypothetical protein
MYHPDNGFQRGIGPGYGRPGYRAVEQPPEVAASAARHGRVLDVQPKLGARVRLLADGAVNKNDPNDARSVAVAALRSRRCARQHAARSSLMITPRCGRCGPSATATWAAPGPRWCAGCTDGHRVLRVVRTGAQGEDPAHLGHSGGPCPLPGEWLWRPCPGRRPSSVGVDLCQYQGERRHSRGQ